MKLLNGTELAGYIKERQAKTVRNLTQEHAIMPKLAIIRTNSAPVVNSYMHMKQQYGDEIGVEVEVHTIEQPNALKEIEKLNKDKSVHGIIVQIPLPDPTQTDEILNAVDVNKDVDGLAEKTKFDPATPMAINWLLAGYNINLPGKNIVVVGNGRLVGKPLVKIWETSDLNVTVIDKKNTDIASITREAEVLVCATGAPGLITKEMVRPDAVIVDAGVATDSNGLVGDISQDVRELQNITITPEKGGVGPLTVCALFENVIRSAQKQTKQIA